MDKDIEEKNNEFIDACVSVMMHIADPSFERASKIAVLICFAMKFIIVVAGCLLLRHVNEAAADLFMLTALAYSFYGHELYINMKVKEELVRKVIAGNISKEECNEDKKDIECKQSAKD